MILKLLSKLAKEDIDEEKHYGYKLRKYPKISFSLTKPSFYDQDVCDECGSKDVKIWHSMNSFFYRLWLGHIALYKTCRCEKCHKDYPKHLGTSYGGIVFKWLEMYDKVKK